MVGRKKVREGGEDDEDDEDDEDSDDDREDEMDGKNKSCVATWLQQVSVKILALIMPD